jgi:hypothetical protein
VADPATSDRQLGNDHREAAGRRLAHLPQCCQPSLSDHALSLHRTHSTWQISVQLLQLERASQVIIRLPNLSAGQELR